MAFGQVSGGQRAAGPCRMLPEPPCATVVGTDPWAPAPSGAFSAVSEALLRAAQACVPQAGAEAASAPPPGGLSQARVSVPLAQSSTRSGRKETKGTT